MQVLLLNNTEEVLNVIPWHRAVRLLRAGKASAPYGHEDYYRIATGNGYFELPTALVLVKYVHIPYKNASLSRRNIMWRDENECQYCRTELNETNQTLDHVLPVSRGGKHEWTNLVACCKSCNARKANRTPAEANMRLLREPAVPTRRVLAIKLVTKKSTDSWKRWM
jgi:5-methylcytosine-specific restriction endonuclease McrA